MRLIVADLCVLVLFVVSRSTGRVLAQESPSSAEQLETIFEWKYLDFLWGSEELRNVAVRNGEYNFSRLVPSDIAISKDGRIFLSHIGYEGVPARLSVISSFAGSSGHLLIPYPDWSWFAKPDCSGITSVYGITIDQCNRLWVLDTGIPEHDVPNNRTCHAQLLAFDVQKDRLIKRIRIPDHIAQNKLGRSLLVKPLVETKGQSCDQTTVYMSDSEGHGLVIWNGIGLFRLEGEVFGPIESAREVLNLESPLRLTRGAGVVDLALSPNLFPYEPRYLFFRPLASYDIYAANTRELTRGVYGYRIKYFGARDILQVQASGQAFSEDGTLFLGLPGLAAIACWNRYRELAKTNIEVVAQDAEALLYPTSLKIVGNRRHGEELWVLASSSKPIVASSVPKPLDPELVNFRILRAPVRRLIEGTSCELPAPLRAALYSKPGKLRKQLPK